MKRIVKVETLKDGDRFEFITTRSEWADNCYLPHPEGVIVVAKSAFLDAFQQCRFGYRLEKFPKSRPQDWWGLPKTEVRLLDKLPPGSAAVPMVSPAVAAKKSPKTKRVIKK
jgi:hypothetical protein